MESLRDLRPPAVVETTTFQNVNIPLFRIARGRIMREFINRRDVHSLDIPSCKDGHLVCLYDVTGPRGYYRVWARAYVNLGVERLTGLSVAQMVEWVRVTHTDYTEIIVVAYADSAYTHPKVFDDSLNMLFRRVKLV